MQLLSRLSFQQYYLRWSVAVEYDRLTYIHFFVLLQILMNALSQMQMGLTHLVATMVKGVAIPLEITPVRAMLCTTQPVPVFVSP